MMFGYAIGSTGATFVMTGFLQHFNWPILTDNVTEPNWVTQQISLITCLFGLGAFFGSLISGKIADLI
eukprot:Pgem_evm1s12767